MNNKEVINYIKENISKFDEIVYKMESINYVPKYFTYPNNLRATVIPNNFNLRSFLTRTQVQLFLLLQCYDNDLIDVERDYLFTVSTNSQYMKQIDYMLSSSPVKNFKSYIKECDIELDNIKTSYQMKILLVSMERLLKKRELLNKLGSAATIKLVFETGKKTSNKDLCIELVNTRHVIFERALQRNISYINILTTIIKMVRCFNGNTRLFLANIKSDITLAIINKELNITCIFGVSRTNNVIKFNTITILDKVETEKLYVDKKMVI